MIRLASSAAHTEFLSVVQAACNILSIAYGLQIANAAVLMTNMFGSVPRVLQFD